MGPESPVPSQEAVIDVMKVGKVFRLPHEKHTSLKSVFVNFYKRRRGYELQQALKDISFNVKRGEFLGIIGKNGSGKSTILKLLAGIYTPTEGDIRVRGKLTPFIELGVGFNMELTGRENVFLNGSLLGFNRREMRAMYKEIVDFAELRKFMDQKLKNYSSGMQVRLAFSIAMRAQSDILLIDEVLAVGDAAFQQKCFEVFAELKKKGVTIILVTHDMNSVLRFCDRVILIDNGKVIKDGLPAVVADSYLELNFDGAQVSQKSLDEAKPNKKTPFIESVQINGPADRPARAFEPNQELGLVISYKNPKGQGMHFGAQIFSDAGVYCFGTNTKIGGLKPSKKKSGHISLDLKAALIPGNYYINAAAMNENATTVYHYKPRAAHLRIMKVTNLEGIAMLDHTWRL